MPDALGFTHKFVPSHGSPFTLLLLHGTGGDENDLIPLGSGIGEGAALLSPLGKTSENGMPRFFRRRAMGVFDLDDLKFRTHELANFVAAAASCYGFDPKKVFALGFSNGANIAASMLLLRPECLAGAVLLRPTIPLVPETLPVLKDARVWIGGGEQDPIVPQGQTEELANLLRRAGGDVTLHWSPGGHNLHPGELAAAKTWLAALVKLNLPVTV